MVSGHKTTLYFNNTRSSSLGGDGVVKVRLISRHCPIPSVRHTRFEKHEDVSIYVGDFSWHAFRNYDDRCPSSPPSLSPSADINTGVGQKPLRLLEFNGRLWSAVVTNVGKRRRRVAWTAVAAVHVNDNYGRASGGRRVRLDDWIVLRPTEKLFCCLYDYY
jgi:hypothetical protein